jgi:hypothetical protein
MGLEEHLNNGNEVKEEGQAAKVDAPLPPSRYPARWVAIKHGWKDRDARRRV